MLNAKDKRLSLISYLMAMLLIANIFMPYDLSYAADHGFDVVKNKSIQLTQGGVVVAEGADISVDKPLELAVRFDVPIGDQAGQIQKGDVLRFDIADNFQVEGEATKTLFVQIDAFTSKRFGQFTIKKEGSKLIGEIAFSGDFFDDPDHGFTEAEAKFSAIIKFDGDPYSVPETGQNVQILEKTFVLKPPAAQYEYKATKTGALVGGNLKAKQIEWTITIEALKNKQPHPLKDYKLVDVLTEVGPYVDGSLQVNGTAVTPSETAPLTYTFPDGTTDKATITFKTTIPDEKLYKQQEQSISNTASFIDEKGGNATTVTSGPVTFSPMWILKEGKGSDLGSSGPYDPTNRTITWTITANHEEFTLHNAYIRDELGSDADGKLGKLKFKEATWQKWNGSGWDAAVPITPENEKDYKFGTINTKILLTIITTVPDAPAGYTASEARFNNAATLHWDNGPGVGGSTYATIGFNAIKKEAVHVDRSNSIVDWKTTVKERKQSIPNLKVYEVFAYSDSGFDPKDVTGLPAGIDVSVFGKDQQAKGQQYVEGTFAATAGSEHLKAGATQGIFNGAGKRVGDWIEVTGFKKNIEESYKLRTKVVSPYYHLGNSNGTTLTATAILFSSNAKLNQSTANAVMPMRVLFKELLVRDAMADPAKHVNNRTHDLNLGFDYKEKAVLYRLSINADSVGFSNRDFFDNNVNEFKKYGTITYTDTLPEGWEFVPISGNEKYMFFDGRKDETSLRSISPDNTPDAPPAGFSADFNGNKAVFTFNNLEKSHIILLKAKPSQEKINEYFTKDGTLAPVNSLQFKAANWAGLVTMRHGVNITSDTIAKAYFNGNVPTEGILEWIVEYKPTELQHTGATIEDKLPIGIDVPTNSNGEVEEKVDGGKTFFIQELELNADGTYSNGKEIAAKIGDNVNYNKDTRTLTFKIPDGNKAYRFKYLTYVTGDPGSVTNNVKLLGTNETSNTGGSTFAIPAIDANVLLRRGGIVTITKVDGTNNTKLPGAVFSIFATGSTTPLRTGTTKSDGKLSLRGIPAGNYTLKEITPPAGYALDTTAYPVVVEKSGNVFVAKVNGTQGNLLTVKNYSTTAGQLKVSNEVTGTASDKSKDFIYTIEFPGGAVYPFSKSDGTSGVLRSGQTFKLKHGENIVFSNMPPGLVVKVTERPDDYTVNAPGAIRNATIEKSKMAEIHYINTKDLPAPTTGGIKVTNAVQGTAADNTKDFDFTVTFSDGKTYAYTGEGGAASGNIKSGEIIKLKHGQSFTIVDIPKDVVVTIVEDPDDYTLVTPDNKQQAKTIVAGTIQQIDYVNEKNAVVPKTGEVTVTNKVEGNAADTNKPFTFTVTFSDGKTYPFTGTNGVTAGNITSGGTIELKHGQSFTITGIPEGVTVTIVENPDDYTLVSPASPSQTVTIKAGEPQKVDYVNKKETGGGGNPGGGGGNPPGTTEVGHLRVNNTVSGSAADLSKEFKYTITFAGNAEFDYTKNGNPAGKIKSGDTFYLMNGEYILVSNMPKDLVVTIVEDAVVAGDYVVDPASKEIVKTIIANDTVLAPFINTKELPVGNVQISNTVSGTGADLNKPFTYTVTFSGPQQYDYEKSDGTTGKISSGQTFTLIHGQTFIIKGMPAGLDVTVTQNAEASYTTTPGALGRIDTIVANSMIYMPFANTISTGGIGGGGGGNPGGSTPSTPQSPVRPDPSNPETIVPPPTPLAPPPPPSTTTPDPGLGDIVDSETIEDYKTPQAQVDSANKSKTSNVKVAGAPKTSGIGNFGSMFKNFLIYGTMLLLLMALVDEYAFKRRY